MNFKKYYINGTKWSIYVSYRNKKYKLEPEAWWNNTMYKLTLFTTKRLTIEKEREHFVIYYRYYFKRVFVDEFSTKKEAQEKVKELRIYFRIN